MTSKSLARQSKKSKHKLTGTPIHSSAGKVIGQVLNGVYVKDITTRHILTKFQSIASDIYSLHEAERAGAEFVEFTNTDDGVTYRASIAKFWDCGKFINFGYGEQQMLSLSHFEHRRDPNESQTDALDYSEPSGTTDIMPLYYKSNAPTGVTVNGVKQMGLFDWGNDAK